MIQDKESKIFKEYFWNPPNPYKFRFPKVKLLNEPLLIYEAHIGIASNEEKIATYADFRQNLLPLIHKQGYNCIMLMAIQHHALYSSFGYQVTNYFSPSSYFLLFSFYCT